MATLEQGAYRSAGGANLTSELWSLLWGAAASPEYRARLCAVEWACDLFDFSDVPARRLCVSLCDDKVTAVRSAASRGLHPPPLRASSFAGAAAAAADAAATATSSRHPRFEAFVLGAMREEAAPSSLALGREPGPASLQELPPAALARALDFALECHRAHGGGGGVDEDSSSQAAKGHGGDGIEEAVAVFLAVIESTLESAPSAADGQHGHAQMVLLHRSAAVALQKLAAGDVSGEPGAAFLHDADGDHQDAPSPDAAARSEAPIVGVAANLASRGPWLQQWLGHEVSTEIREAFAETTGAAAEFMEPDSELVPLLRALGHKLKVKGGTERKIAACAAQIVVGSRVRVFHVS